MSEKRIEYPPGHVIRAGFEKITEEALDLASDLGESASFSPRIEGALRTLNDLRLCDGDTKAERCHPTKRRPRRWRRRRERWTLR